MTEKLKEEEDKCRHLKQVLIQLERRYREMNKHQQNVGLIPERISKLRFFFADFHQLSEICCICREDVELEFLIELDCEHFTGEECEKKWFKEHNTCPLCMHVHK